MWRTYVGAFAASAAGGAVEEVLLHAETVVGAELGTGAGELAVVGVAGVGVVVGGEAAHQRLALQVATGALAAGAGEAVLGIAASLSVWLLGVGRTGGAVTGAALLGVARARAGSTDERARRELTTLTAGLVAVVADGVAAELARPGVAALVVAAGFIPATIAVFAFFDDAVAALLTRDERDALVDGETVGLDGVAADGGADVANGAGGEVGDAIAGGGVHDVLLAGIA
jgi:hypothetical protein